MSKEQRLNRLNELIAATGIYEAIASIEVDLYAYLESEHINSNRYAIVMEEVELRRTIEQLKDQLANLTRYSLRHEKRWDGI